ncbi:MAG: arsenate reductase, partial [Deltaproteobacteria bacterium]|nr:arsenate reductase [Deltaproteobacteria bacterium]
MSQPVILFLCIGNSIRSQMAEGFVRHYGENKIECLSAGISP